MRPFLRWAGGKRWLAQQVLAGVSKNKRLVEPFLGGGALFFFQTWERAVLSDINRFLINAYISMRDDHKNLFLLVKQNFDQHSPTHYYSVRSRMGASTIQDAADFLYLNRSCFNGLFRVNLAGRFNVPIGTKAFELRDPNEFARWSSMLQTADVFLADFEETIALCGEGDLIFADPPYTVNHNKNGFIEYNEKIFRWEDQVRLRDCLFAARDRGAQFVLTNADHPAVHDLYLDCSRCTVERGSEMASRNSARGKTSEVLITS